MVIKRSMKKYFLLEKTSYDFFVWKFYYTPENIYFSVVFQNNSGVIPKYIVLMLDVKMCHIIQNLSVNYHIGCKEDTFLL